MRSERYLEGAVGESCRDLQAMVRILDYILRWEPLDSFKQKRGNAVISPRLI